MNNLFKLLLILSLTFTFSACEDQNTKIEDIKDEPYIAYNCEENRSTHYDYELILETEDLSEMNEQLMDYYIELLGVDYISTSCQSTIRGDYYSQNFVETVENQGYEYESIYLEKESIYNFNTFEHQRNEAIEIYTEWLLDLIEVLIYKPALETERVEFNSKFHTLRETEDGLIYIVETGDLTEIYNVYRESGQLQYTYISTVSDVRTQGEYYKYIPDNTIKSITYTLDEVETSVREIEYDLNEYFYLNTFLHVSEEHTQSSVLLFDAVNQVRLNLNQKPDDIFYIIHLYKDNEIMFGEFFSDDLTETRHDYYFSVKNLSNWEKFQLNDSKVLTTNGTYHDLENLNDGMFHIDSYLNPFIQVKTGSESISEELFSSPTEALDFSVLTYDEFMALRSNYLTELQSVYKVNIDSVTYNGNDYSFDQDFMFLVTDVIPEEVFILLETELN